MRLLYLAAMLFCLGVGMYGCTLAPVYERPAMPTSAQWPDSAASTNESGPEMAAWNEFFTDPAIQALVNTALVNNRDMRIAMLNIEKARAQYYIQRADLLPSIDANAGMSVQHLPKDLSMMGQAGISRQYSVTVGFSAYELDLFGRIRSLKESALQRYLATEEAAKSAQASLVGEVAGAYLQLVADKEQLALATAAYENHKGVHDIVQTMFEQGLSSQLDLSQARSSVEEARVIVAQWQTRAAQDANALAFLVGAPYPPDVPQADSLKGVSGLPDLPEGLPSELLQRRPDIMMAERELQSANADIGAARANFFPAIGLTTTIGTITTQFSNLFSGGAGTWSFAPAAVLPIFDTGRNWATLQATKAQRDIAVAQYEKAIQQAFREVADALAQRATIGEQLAGEMALVETTKNMYDLALLRFTAGLDNYTAVLDAQRSLLGAQQALVNTLLLREINTIALYKALGGGWRQAEAAAAGE